MKYNVTTRLSLCSNALSPVVAMCLLSLSTDLLAADKPVYLSQNTDTNSYNIDNVFLNDVTQFSSRLNISSGKAANIALFKTGTATQSKLLLDSYNAQQQTIINEGFAVDNQFSIESQLTWQNTHFSQRYFHIDNSQQETQFSHNIFATPSDSLQYYQAQLATYNKNKTIMATLAYESATNNHWFSSHQANLEADIAFYNPYKYFSRVNLNYKKSLVGLEVSQLGMGLTFYGDMNLSILSLLSIEDINNKRFPKKMNLSIGISAPL